MAVGLVIALVAAAFAFATRSETTVTAAALFECIDRADTGPFTRSTDDLDLVAADAGDGAMALHSDQQDITLVVERSTDDAEATEAQYETFADAFGPGGHVERHGNVVAVFSKTPASLERGFVDGCVP